MSHSEDVQRWIKNVMSKIMESFGPNIDEARYEITKPDGELYMSTMYYACVKFKNRMTSQNEEWYMILKRPIQEEQQRQRTNCDLQFRNEILFYRTYAQPDENFPRCFYADERPPTDSIIALENLNKRGYCLCPCKTDVPMEYTLAAVRELGRFHGKGYVMKELQKDKFFDIMKQFQEARFGKTNEEFRLLVNSQATRVVEYLRNHGYDVTFCDKIEAVLLNAFDRVMLETIKPLEPLATLCHGDFTLNNILFKKEDDGQQHAMLIDFALIGYLNPVVDLSTYLCLCFSNEIKNKFSEIMQTYHNALKEYLEKAGVWDVKKYSYNALLDDYKRGALFGFVIASFFLAKELGYYEIEQVIYLETTEFHKFIKYQGGDEVSKILADMLLHLKDVGCLEHFL
ncbi:uncharacterized protein LOC105200820 [Solenopsis invicta]|uniref:uncharacterized protein LOC105200820 n=1 Tax=Solenopsis invicta TaxID=13686 RepID=UPI000595D9C0|nr:uncharacterized protein LOC105200820 [Solenopsis invicta]